jgi:hypothetical protein
MHCCQLLVGKVAKNTQESLIFFHKNSLSVNLYGLQATFYRRIIHRLGFLDSCHNYANHTLLSSHLTALHCIT